MHDDEEITPQGVMHGGICWETRDDILIQEVEPRIVKSGRSLRVHILCV